MSSILERSGLGWLVSEAEKKLRAARGTSVPVNQDEQELALALSGATILGLLKNASDHRMSFFEMRRSLDRPVKEMILAVDRLAQLQLVAYGDGDLIQLTDPGIQLT